MKPAKVSSRIHVLFSVAGMIGVAFPLAGCFLPGCAAYTPAPIKPPKVASSL